MRKKKDIPRVIARELSPADTQKLLLKIGKVIKAKRKTQTTLENFAYEINVSRSAMTRYEAGEDMYLSTFLKLLHGLDIEPSDFFNEVQ